MITESNTALDKNIQSAVDAYRAGDNATVKNYCHKHLKRKPGDFNALQIMAMTLRAEEKYNAAIEYYKKAEKAAPMVSLKHQMKVDLAVCYQENNLPNLALELLGQVLTADMTNALALHRKGSILRAHGDEQAALECFKQVVMYPREICSGAEITRGKAHWHILTTPSLKPTAVDIAQAEADLNWLEDPEELANLRFALYNGYERLGLYQQAWDMLKQANQHVWSRVNFDLLPLNDSLERACRQIFELEPGRTCLDNRYTPVFIAGLPRSGSTLLESVLLEHPRVSSRGESQLVAAAYQAVIGKDFVTSAPQAGQLAAIAKKLERELFKQAAESDVVIDKTPNNFLFSHLLIQIFHGVKIINTVKDPLEACFSLYRQHFLKQQQQAYTYDLVSTVLYYRWHEKITDTLGRRFPESVLNIDYRHMTEPDSSIWPRLFEFCGLEWDKTFLQFQRSKRQVKTISAAQLRQGLSPEYRSRAAKYGVIIDELDELLTLDIDQLVSMSATRV